jgi:hypothetical protein
MIVLCVKLVSNLPRVVGIQYASMESKEIPYFSMESKEIPYISMESKEIPYVSKQLLVPRFSN